MRPPEMFSNRMLRRREFYDLLTSHIDRLMAAANTVLRLVNSLGAGSSETGELVKEVGLNEQSGNKIKAEFIALSDKDRGQDAQAYC